MVKYLKLLGCSQAVRHQTLTLAFRWFEPIHPSQERPNPNHRVRSFSFLVGIGFAVRPSSLLARIWCALFRESRCQLASIRLEKKPRQRREAIVLICRILDRFGLTKHLKCLQNCGIMWYNKVENGVNVCLN